MVENPPFDADLAGFQLGIFAKQPVPGRVKTRLTPPLTPAEAAELYAVSLRETLERCLAAGLAPVLFYAGDRAYFEQACPGVELVAQADGDLGGRMQAALARLLAAVGCRGAALIGSDSPDLPLALLREAFAGLQASDCVVAPAADGGYVLIGMRRLRCELLAGMPWSTSGLLDATRNRARQAGIGYQEVSGWEDVDDLHSLHRLMRRSPRSKTARFAAGRLRRLFPQAG